MAEQGSLMDAMEERMENVNDKLTDREQAIDMLVDYVRDSAPTIGQTPWSVYVQRASAADGPPLYHADAKLNQIELSYKMVPLPVHMIPESMSRQYDEMAMMDEQKSMLMPMLATNFYMYTPQLLMLLSARPSSKILEELRNSCLTVAGEWKVAPEEERGRLLQNLVELKDIYANTKQQMEAVQTKDWPERIIATQAVAQYRRVMNMIRMTHGFSMGDPDYAENMKKLIEAADQRMTTEVQRLVVNNPIYALLTPLRRQIANTGSVYDLGMVDSSAFQEHLVNFTIEVVRLMETWLLRVTSPDLPEKLYFYHLSSLQIPNQHALDFEELSALRNQTSVAQRVRSTYDPFVWPEFHRSPSIVNSLATSLRWTGKDMPVPQMNRINTATAMIACTCVMIRGHHQKEVRDRAFSAFQILCQDDYSANRWNDTQWIALLTNTEDNCGAGDERPIELVGSAYIEGI